MAIDCGCTSTVDGLVDCGTVCNSGGNSGGHCQPSNWSMYDDNNPEYMIFESNLCEVTDISGFPIEYRTLLPKNDRLFGEDPNSGLSDPATTKVIYAPETESNLLDLFGLTADDTLQYMFIPKLIFSRDMSGIFEEFLGDNIAVRPRVGDVITTLWNNRNYEITNISEEDDIFLAKKYTYSLILKPFRFSEQSDEHREVHMGLPDDPFASIVSGPSGDYIQNNYATDNFGDNDVIDNESGDIYDYDDEGPQLDVDFVDPDIDAFGR